MKYHKILGILLAVTVLCTSIAIPVKSVKADTEIGSDYKLVFQSPGEGKYQGLPIANGKIAARIHGGVKEDLYRLNDATFWSFEPTELRYGDKSGTRKAALEQTRGLLEGDLHDLEQIKKIEASAKKMVSDAPNVGGYMPLGDMKLTFPNTDRYTGYERSLDIGTAIATVDYTANGVEYTRESFVSYPDNVLVTRLTASKNESISVNVALEGRMEVPGNPTVVTTDSDEVIMDTRAPYSSSQGSSVTTWIDGHGMRAQSRVKVIPTGGEMTAKESSIDVKNANEVLLIYASETSYNGFDRDPYSDGKEYIPLVKEYIDHAAAKRFDELKAAHMEDYQSIFNNLSIEINGDPLHKNALSLQLKRYNMIATSRQGDRPRSAFGIWNEDYNPTSDASHYLNENLEKMYALIETANMTETGYPLWNYLEELSDNGTKTAEMDFGFRGWTCGHNSDIWATTGLRGGKTEWGIFPVGGMWLSYTLWEHYLFTGDEDFLREKAYPILKGAAEFANDLLVERTFTQDEVNCEPGTYFVTSPSTSCENSYGINYGETYVPGLYEAVTIGSTQDLVIVRNTFESVIEAAKVLGFEEEEKGFLDEISYKLERLLPYQVYSGANEEQEAFLDRIKDGVLITDYNLNGGIQEYAIKDFAPNWNRDLYYWHRHISHLLGLFPYDDITAESPDWLKDAALHSLDNRGPGNAGRMPDKGAMYARLGEGDKAIQRVETGTNTLFNVWCGDTLQNAVCEVLLQSHAGYLDILPALPSSWQSGKIYGICARGGYELDIEWSNGELVTCNVVSKSGNGIPQVRYRGQVINLNEDKRFTYSEETKLVGEAGSVQAELSPIERKEGRISCDFKAKASEPDTRTSIYAKLDVYEEGNLIRSVEEPSVLYGEKSENDRVQIHMDEYNDNGKSYSFVCALYKRSDDSMIGNAVTLDQIEFESLSQTMDIGTGNHPEISSVTSTTSDYEIEYDQNTIQFPPKGDNTITITLNDAVDVTNKTLDISWRMKWDGEKAEPGKRTISFLDSNGNDIVPPVINDGYSTIKFNGNIIGSDSLTNSYKDCKISFFQNSGGDVLAQFFIGADKSKAVEVSGRDIKQIVLNSDASTGVETRLQLINSLSIITYRDMVVKDKRMIPVTCKSGDMVLGEDTVEAFINDAYTYHPRAYYEKDGKFYEYTGLTQEYRVPDVTGVTDKDTVLTLEYKLAEDVVYFAEAEDTQKCIFGKVYAVNTDVPGASGGTSKTSGGDTTISFQDIGLDSGDYYFKLVHMATTTGSRNYDLSLSKGGTSQPLISGTINKGENTDLGQTVENLETGKYHFVYTVYTQAPAMDYLVVKKLSKNVPGIASSSVEYDGTTVTARIKANQISGVHIVALYDHAGALLKVFSKEVSFGENETKEEQYDVSSVQNVHSVKSYLWDGFETMNPLFDTAQS